MGDLPLTRLVCPCLYGTGSPRAIAWLLGGTRGRAAGPRGRWSSRPLLSVFWASEDEVDGAADGFVEACAAQLVILDGVHYSVYTDDHHIYYSFSTDHGQTWSGPYLITTTSGTQIFPWSTAGDPGKLDVVFYETPYYDGVNTPDNYPSSAAWTVGFAQNLNALTPGSAWTRQTVSPTNHFGGVCEAGVTCTGNRDLFDDFGVAPCPTTGLASIIYSDDQFDPSGPNTSGCDTSTNNSSSCDHTAIATQTSGTGIFTIVKKKK